MTSNFVVAVWRTQGRWQTAPMADARRQFRFLTNEEFRKLPSAERARYIRDVMKHLLDKLKHARKERPGKRDKE